VRRVRCLDGESCQRTQLPCRPGFRFSVARAGAAPEGRSENSQALQCRVCPQPKIPRRGATDEGTRPSSDVAPRRRNLNSSNPGPKAPGYFRCAPLGRLLQATPIRYQAKGLTYEPRMLSVICRRCGARRCSKRKTPCHVPSCRLPSAIGITSLERVKTERICEVLSSPPSAVCSK
jgi:hypothetical protein